MVDAIALAMFGSVDVLWFLGVALLGILPAFDFKIIDWFRLSGGL